MPKNCLRLRGHISDDGWVDGPELCPAAGPGGHYEEVACDDGWTRFVPVPDPTRADAPLYDIYYWRPAGRRWKLYNIAMGPLLWRVPRAFGGDVHTAFEWLTSGGDRAVVVPAGTRP